MSDFKVFDVEGLTEFGTDALAETKGFERAQPAAETSTDTTIEIMEGLSHRRTSHRRTFQDLTRVANAAKHIAMLPAWGESIHAVMKGNYNAWDIIPALIRLAEPATVEELCVTTLGFNERNADELLSMIDAGKVKDVRFVCSCYFKATSAKIYQHMAEGLENRGQKILAMRNHSKIMLIKFSDGDAIVVESSANLRSCRNVEQFVMTNDTGLYDFHRQWIGHVFKEGGSDGPRT